MEVRRWIKRGLYPSDYTCPECGSTLWLVRMSEGDDATGEWGVNGLILICPNCTPILRLAGAVAATLNIGLVEALERLGKVVGDENVEGVIEWLHSRKDVRFRWMEL